MKARSRGDPGETPAIVVFAERDQEHRAVLDCLGGATCRPYTTWNMFERALPDADVAVVVLPRLERTEYASLGSLRAAHPDVPVVLITVRDPDNLLHLKDAFLDDVVYLHALPQELPKAARGALEGRCLARAARLVEAVPGGHPDLLTALGRACRLPMPPRTVVALAAIAGWDRRTLYQQWQKSFPAARTPHDFLQWLLLMHAMRLRLRYRSWTAVARALRADRRTLEACAANVAGMQLAETVELRCEGWLAMLRVMLGSV
jgi:hypothetical protein